LIKHDKRHIYTLAFFYSMLIVLIVSLPALFYISVEKKNYLRTQMQHLTHYAYGVEKAIYDFSRTNGYIFDFPRSLFYNAYLYDSNGKKIFTTSSQEYKMEMFGKPIKNIISKQIILSSNKLNAKTLFITQPFSYRDIYLKALISALFIGAVIFIMTLFFIKLSFRPLEKVNRYLNTFFNDAMHELKTPLGVMQLNLEILREKEETKALRRLFSSMQSMILIYDDIEYHIKHDKVTYQSEKIDLSYLLSSRVEVFQDISKAKNISITEEITPNLFWTINRIELQRIIDNTLSNAIKYSPKDTFVTVTLKKEGKALILCVKDQGVGIQDTKRIFERYRREDTIQGGFGIGLSIVKHICDKYHIGIEIETSPDKGSTFIYTFR